jgi:sigma-B regulation protein RsbU (phosphoserine phosphatase)
MELAHDLQLKLLPSPDRFRELGEIAVRCVPADSVGGDFYHLFRLPHGRVGVMIGDVSSHGFAAALIMALTMSAAAIHASEGDPPAEVLRRVHHALIGELETTEMYMTLFYGVIDPAGRRLTFANAGHSHAFQVSRAGVTTRFPVTNPPFGIVDVDDYAQQSIEWAPGEDLLFLFTDGLCDALCAPGGEQTLTSLVAERRHQPLESILDQLFALEPERFDIPPDDRSAVLMRV